MEMCLIASQNDLVRMRAWHAAGADVNYSDYDKRTPLHIVCLVFGSLMFLIG